VSALWIGNGERGEPPACGICPGQDCTRTAPVDIQRDLMKLAEQYDKLAEDYGRIDRWR
jgi:hypothetical protein